MSCSRLSGIRSATNTKHGSDQVWQDCAWRQTCHHSRAALPQPPPTVAHPPADADLASCASSPVCPTISMAVAALRPRASAVAFLTIPGCQYQNRPSRASKRGDVHLLLPIMASSSSGGGSLTYMSSPSAFASKARTLYSSSFVHSPVSSMKLRLCSLKIGQRYFEYKGIPARGSLSRLGWRHHQTKAMLAYSRARHI